MSCTVCSPASRTGRGEKPSKLASPRSKGKGRSPISPKEPDQAQKYRKIGKINNISSKKCRENKIQAEKRIENRKRQIWKNNAAYYGRS